MADPALSFCVAALYRFARFDAPQALREPLAALCDQLQIKGTLLLAREGINGTIAGSDLAIAEALAHIRELPGCAGLEVKFSRAAAMPFRRMKVRIKREIVTMGEPDIDPLTGAGSYVAPEDWNALISDPATLVIDTRNDYEVAVGTFVGAIDPKTQTFREFPEWFRAARARLLGEGKAPRVAMFCTGGIRCEKSTAFLKREGIEDVFHLKGGILKYLENVPPEQSLWQGECFVFDERVTVGHGLVQGAYKLCRACRRPLSDAGRASSQFEEGVSCPSCYNERGEEQREGYRERHRQEARAAALGTAHIGMAKARLAGPILPTMTARPVLYSFRRCPYAIRARLAILASGVVCELREVKLSAKPAEMIDLSPKGTVPVLVLADGKVIDESIDIMRWALGENDPELWLRGDDAALIASNDGPFKYHLDRYKYPHQHSVDPVEHRLACLEQVALLDTRLAKSANLCGEHPGITDAALLPFIRQFASVDREWFATQILPHLQGWLARHLSTPRFSEAMARFEPWRPGDEPVLFPALPL